MDRIRQSVRGRSVPRTSLLAPISLVLLAAVASVALSFGRVPPAAVAASVPQIAGQVTDQAGVVGARAVDIERALGDLLEARNVQLYVVFVTSTGGDQPQAFARATFESNGLGGNDMLLLVAVQDRRYSWWDNGAIPSLASTQVDQLLSRTLEPRFRASDYPGGVIDFASALSAALGGAGGGTVVAPAVPQPDGTAAPQSQPAFGPAAGPVLGVLLVLAGIVILWAWWRRRRLAHLSAEERDRRTGELARQANGLLITADDSVRDAQQELGFAEAEFDEPDVAPLRAAIVAAQDELKGAFSVRQQLDDDVPEDPETRERMLGEIVRRANRVASLLDEQRRRVQALRDQEGQSPQLLAALPARIEAVAARVAATQPTVEQLHSYAETDWHAVSGNLAEASKRVDAASAEAKAGTSALAATPPDQKAAASSVRRAQQAVLEATALLDAVDHLASTLDEARGQLDGEIAGAETDLKAALADPTRPEGTVGPPATKPDLVGRLAEAQALLAEAKRQYASATPDVLLALKNAQTAHATADEALADVRQAEEQRAREQAMLTAALQSAVASVGRAQDFIATRREGVDREARTRLAEAERHLEQARSLSATDTAAAGAEAALAVRLADEAYDRARSDFEDWDGRGGRRGDDLGRLILGGIILGNVLGGAGRRGGGWGGTPWGMPGGGGRGGGGSWGGGSWGGGGGRGGGGGW